MKTYDKKISQLINLYLRAERRLINIISTKKVKGHVTDFYESMLKQVKLELMQLQLQSARSSKELVNELYLEAYHNSLEALGISNIGDGFAQLHKNAIEVLSDNLINNFAEVNNQVRRRIEDSIRNIGLTDAQIKFATGQTIMQLQDELVNNLIKKGIGGITDKRGRVIPFTSYVEILSRSIVAETQNTCVMNVAKEYEKDLVKMTQHNTTCPICAVYEGRVYSLTGKDERFPKLSNIPGFNKGYNNIHPRCRHRITPYIEKYNDVKEDIKNSNRPFEVDKDKEASIKAYQEEQREKARLRNDKNEYEKYRQILGEEAPKSLQSFREIKYNDSERWDELKQSYKIVNSYKVDFGYVSPRKILELDKLAFNAKKTRFDYTKFTGKDRKDIKNLGRSGNFAVMEFEGKLYFSHSSVNDMGESFFESITGSKSDFILHKDNREFETLIINNIQRHYCTEAKMFEFLNDNIGENYSKEITILSELDMCDSCRMVLNEQFLKKYPNIKVNIISGKNGVNWRKRK